MTHLRKVMLEELQRRNFAATTIQYYLDAVEGFAEHFGKPPDRLGQAHLRQYQAYLFQERKLKPGTVQLQVAALRFFFVKTLKRPYRPDEIPYPKFAKRLPVILTVEEVGRLIDSAQNLFHRTLLMALYSTGMRNREWRKLQVRDIDSRSMLIHVRYGKGGRDRFVPLSPSCSKPCASTGVGWGPRPGCFPARSTVGAPISPLPRKSFGRLASLRRSGPESRSAFTHIS